MRRLVEHVVLRSLKAIVVALHSGASVGIHLDASTVAHTLTASHLFLILPRAGIDVDVAVGLEVNRTVHLDVLQQKLLLEIFIHIRVEIAREVFEKGPYTAGAALN